MFVYTHLNIVSPNKFGQLQLISIPIISSSIVVILKYCMSSTISVLMSNVSYNSLMSNVSYNK